MKFLGKVLVVLIILGVAAVVTLNAVLKKETIEVIQEASGFNVQIDAFKVGLLKPTITTKGLHLVNPDKFPDRDALVMDKMKLRYKPTSLWQDTVHISDAYMDIKKVVVIISEDGDLNYSHLAQKSGLLDKLSFVNNSIKVDPEAEEVNPAAESGSRSKDILIADLTVKMGTVELRTYKTGTPEPAIEIMEINETIDFQSISSLEEVFQTIALEALSQNIPEELLDLAEQYGVDINDVSGSVGDVIEAVGGLLDSFLNK